MITGFDQHSPAHNPILFQKIDLFQLVIPAQELLKYATADKLAYCFLMICHVVLLRCDM